MNDNDITKLVGWPTEPQMAIYRALVAAVDNEIETSFVAGKNADENSKCPQHLLKHWWTRGFAYTARLNRAISVEAELKKITAQRNSSYGYGSDAGKPPWME